MPPTLLIFVIHCNLFSLIIYIANCTNFSKKHYQSFNAIEGTIFFLISKLFKKTEVTIDQLLTGV